MKSNENRRSWCQLCEFFWHYTFVVKLFRKNYLQRVIKFNMKIVPTILSGASGICLWPLSSKEFPKKYSPLASDNIVLRETILRHF
jgi:hypothetical protein